MKQISAKTLYEKLESKRKTYLDRARDCAKVTLPYLFPPEGFGASSRLETPWSSVGARGVNNLAAKLLMALLPPNSPFFRLVYDEYKLKQDEEVPPEVFSELDKSLQKIEEYSMQEVAKRGFRTKIFEGIKHLIVGGNVMLYMPKTGLRVFHLDRFVVQRDPMGRPLTMITYEDRARSTLTPQMEEIVGASEGASKTEPETVPLHTICTRSGDKWIVWQELDGKLLPWTQGEYALDRCPFIPLRFSLIDGEDYGRGLCEENLGDLESLEALTKAIREGAAAAAKILYLVRKNGSTSQKVIAEAPNGAIVAGDAEDVTVLQLDKYADFRVAAEEKRGIEERLNAVFLLGAGLVRDAERVTAEEIRMIQQELESQHGGLYSLLATEAQQPLAQRLLDVLGEEDKMPKLPKDLVEPIIITGLEALGRGQDLAKLDAFVNGIAQTFGPQAVQEYVVAGEYLTRRAAALSLKSDGLLRSEDEVAQMRQAAQQQALMQQAAGPMVNAGAKILTAGQGGGTPSA